MITCPNCNHQNPDGALQCEACYTPLPAQATCPSCNAAVQTDASFCGICGHDLRNAATSSAGSDRPEASGDPDSAPDSSMATQNFLVPEPSAPPTPVSVNNDSDIPDLVAPDPLVVPEPISGLGSEETQSEATQSEEPSSAAEPTPDIPSTISSFGTSSEAESEPAAGDPYATPSAATPAESATPAGSPSANPQTPAPPIASPATQLQMISARLRQVQTDTVIEIPRQLSVVRIGKPNDQTPPDIDVSGFPDSEIVSRVHANLRVEGDTYFLEDVGSSNGTYINGLPLPVGNRHRLRSGDRIAIGKGDKVSFIFETAS